MLETIPVLFSKSYWRFSFSPRRFGGAMFSAFGVQWTAVKCTSYFFPAISAAISHGWYWFLAAGLGWAAWMCRPSRGATYELPGRDVSIELLVGNLFSGSDPIIVGANTTFATDPKDISPKSVQGQFTQRYYTSVVHLDADIQNALTATTPVATHAQGKPEYRIGTVAKVAPKSRVAFLVAIAKLNPHGTAHGSFEELKVALADLWQFIAERGGDVCPIRVPVLGTGYSRIAEPRHEVIKEIVRSFLAACAERTFCEKLTIVISPKDFSSHEIDFAELSDFVRLNTKYAQIRHGRSWPPASAPQSRQLRTSSPHLVLTTFCLQQPDTNGSRDTCGQ